MADREFVNKNGLHAFQAPMSVEDLARHVAAIQVLVADNVKDHVDSAGAPRLLYMAIAGWMIGHAVDLEEGSPSRVAFAVGQDDEDIVKVFDRIMCETLRMRAASAGMVRGPGGAS